jgi:pimeloyl-ACP methyl ester carboxylesterase
MLTFVVPTGKVFPLLGSRPTLPAFGNIFYSASIIMANTTRLFKSFTRLLFPAIFLILLAIVAGSVWLVETTARPLNSRYLVTPDKYGQLSSRAAQVTDETWQNRDGSQSRGWLLRGAENAPAVILLHKFGADRSYVLNLGVKLNESTNFTVLMPDQRGHGDNPLVKNASFGGCEAEDLSTAIEFLRNLKTTNQMPLVGQKNIGIFGVEMGAMVAIAAAAKDTSVKAIALDSVPLDSDTVLKASVVRRFPFVSFATTKLARLGTYLYYFDGCYQREPVCDIARSVEGRNVMLLAGLDAQEYQDSTGRLSKCFPQGTRIESKLDLSPSGFSITNASMEQSEMYDQRLIDFFRKSLGN